MYRRNPHLGTFTFGAGAPSTGFGNPISDPVIPAVSGAQFLKVIGALFATAWVFRQFRRN